MVRTLLSARFIQNVLLPGWIFVVGIASLLAPPMGVAVSLSMFVTGVFVVPALVLMLRPAELTAVISTPAARD